ncbi:MAG TPA: redoxin domain-containing protein [Anaerolineaceae bacterium]|nr:redoxin domain-containing protein [Anaerolineaceae bacterium]
MLRSKPIQSLMVGLKAPDFTLNDLENKAHSLSDYIQPVVVINFWSAECPWAERGDHLILEWMKDWQEKVVLLTVASNINEPPDLLKKVAEQRGLPFVLRDINHQVADLYCAETTPHVYVLDEHRLVRYMGGLDDVTFRKHTASQYYLRLAVEALLDNRQPDISQTDPFGCTIVRFSV